MNLDLTELFTMPASEGVNYYIEKIIKGNTSNMELQERAILTAAFIQDYTILTQYAMAQTLEDIKERSM